MMQKNEFTLKTYLAEKITSLCLFLLFGLVLFWAIEQLPVVLEQLAGRMSEIEVSLKQMH